VVYDLPVMGVLRRCETAAAAIFQDDQVRGGGTQARADLSLHAVLREL